MAAVSSSAVNDRVASQSDPNKAKEEKKGSRFHEADGDNIVVPPVASNSIEFQTHWKRLRRNKQCLAQSATCTYTMLCCIIVSDVLDSTACWLWDTPLSS